MSKNYSLELCSKDEIEKFTSSINLVLLISPHQIDPLQGKSIKNKSLIKNEKIVILPCVCQTKSKNNNVYNCFQKSYKIDKISTFWITPSLMPISCFLACIESWKQFSENIIDEVILGIFIPVSLIKPNSNNFDMWDISMTGRNKINNQNKIKNIVWYTNLSRSEEELKPIVEKLNISEIFPITDILCKYGIDTSFNITNHKLFLNTNKVRTEKIMYINQKTPNETFEYLTKSIENLPRRPRITTPVITPGDIPINYLPMSLAAVFTNSSLLINHEESFSKELTDNCLILRSGEK